MTTKSEIERVLWNACDSFRGKIDSSRYKDYILSIQFGQMGQRLPFQRGSGCQGKKAGKNERFSGPMGAL